MHTRTHTHPTDFIIADLFFVKDNLYLFLNVVSNVNNLYSVEWNSTQAIYEMEIWTGSNYIVGDQWGG